MTIHRKDEIDRKLKAQLGFWKGIWLAIRIVGRFIVSLGPHNWSLTKLATSEQKIEIPEGRNHPEVRHEEGLLK